MAGTRQQNEGGEGGLFGEGDEPAPVGSVDASMPLAARMRPRTLDEFVGQEEVVGEGTLLRRAIEEDRLSSLILWGPPGCGKSTLASIIARRTRAAFEPFSAVTSGVADVRQVIRRAQERRRKTGQRTILFIDEIHRWNRAQQDALLPHVEEGTIILIGATTENPFFEVNGPLLSRSRIFRLEPLTRDAILALLRRALADKDRGLGGRNVAAEEEALRHIADIAGGDARVALNILETAVDAVAPPDGAGPTGLLTLAVAEEAAQRRILLYDRESDEHYDTISAFIKSVRGSDPDAALYWLAKMVLAGEDPKFIARRLVILASEDIGNADPMGLVVAQAGAEAVMFVGMPEAQLTLAQVTTYLACAPKSNASMVGLSRAMKDIRERGAAPVPLHLRNAAHPGLGQFGYGAGYRYPHDEPDGWVPQEYLPRNAASGPYYEPVPRGVEAHFRELLERLRSNRQQSTPAHAPKSSGGSRKDSSED
ncbi:MAG: replication-associated recombination protein A [Chthonomonadales bacterium]